MPNTTTNNSLKWIGVLSALVLAGAFFLPWLNWNGTSVTGSDFPSGQFFKVSEERFGLANPFPEYSFLNYGLWLIPALAIISAILFATNRKPGLLAALAGVMALSLATVYVRFTDTIIEQVGTVKSLLPALQAGLYATVAASIGIIVACMPRQWLLKLLLIVLGPIASWLGFGLLAGSVFKDHDNTQNVKSAYTVDGLMMIREFEANDSLANAKYKEQIITVNGKASEVEILNDSTVNVKISDTTGSYAIFSFGKPDATDAKKLTTGQDISVKGSCSGGEHSDILGVTFITFKRSILNNKQ